jgi:hypothetical protein
MKSSEDVTEVAADAWVRVSINRKIWRGPALQRPF